MKTLNVSVKSKSGLHARPASLLVSLSQQFRSDVTIQKEGRWINAKSIMGVLSLGAQNGDPIVVAAEGPDEEAAIQALEELFERKLPNE